MIGEGVNNQIVASAVVNSLTQDPDRLDIMYSHKLWQVPINQRHPTTNSLSTELQATVLRPWTLVVQQSGQCRLRRMISSQHFHQRRHQSRIIHSLELPLDQTESNPNTPSTPQSNTYSATSGQSLKHNTPSQVEVSPATVTNSIVAPRSGPFTSPSLPRPSDVKTTTPVLRQSSAKPEAVPSTTTDLVTTPNAVSYNGMPCLLEASDSDAPDYKPRPKQNPKPSTTPRRGPSPTQIERQIIRGTPSPAAQAPPLPSTVTNSITPPRPLPQRRAEATTVETSSSTSPSLATTTVSIKPTPVTGTTEPTKQASPEPEVFRIMTSSMITAVGWQTHYNMRLFAALTLRWNIRAWCRSRRERIRERTRSEERPPPATRYHDGYYRVPRDSTHLIHLIGGDDDYSLLQDPPSWFGNAAMSDYCRDAAVRALDSLYESMIPTEQEEEYIQQIAASGVEADAGNAPLSPEGRAFLMELEVASLDRQRASASISRDLRAHFSITLCRDSAYSTIYSLMREVIFQRDVIVPQPRLSLSEVIYGVRHAATTPTPAPGPALSSPPDDVEVTRCDSPEPELSTPYMAGPPDRRGRSPLVDRADAISQGLAVQVRGIVEVIQSVMNTSAHPDVIRGLQLSLTRLERLYQASLARADLCYEMVTNVPRFRVHVTYLVQARSLDDDDSPQCVRGMTVYRNPHNLPAVARVIPQLPQSALDAMVVEPSNDHGNAQIHPTNLPISAQSPAASHQHRPPYQESREDIRETQRYSREMQARYRQMEAVDRCRDETFPAPSAGHGRSTPVLTRGLSVRAEESIHLTHSPDTLLQATIPSQRIASLLATAPPEAIRSAVERVNATHGRPHSEATEDRDSLASGIRHLLVMMESLTTDPQLAATTPQAPVSTSPARSPMIRTRTRSVIPVDFRVKDT